jgi:hypothetical protein
MTRFRNALMMFGAVAASAEVVHLLTSFVLPPRAWAGAGTDTRTIAWLLGATCVSAGVAGLLAGVATDVPKSVGWTGLLGVLAGLSSGPLVSWKAFSGFPAWAGVTFATYILAAVVAMGCFHLVTPRVGRDARQVV